ncbi:hypothetical protein HanPI659440_Chr11g0428281 [Helianthus annuus]|nr:hypothetical protein HanPI659440_Chr11g0428281 [Helianthus annuus]
MQYHVFAIITLVGGRSFLRGETRVQFLIWGKFGRIPTIDALVKRGIRVDS